MVSWCLGVILRVGSYRDWAAQTQRRRGQPLIHGRKRISHDAFEYGAEPLNLEDLRQRLVGAAKQRKAHQARESCRINGWLLASLEANEPCHRRSRCGLRGCQREVEVVDEHGQKQQVTEYYPRDVWAQIHGPKLNGLLDREPIRPGQAEAEAA